MEQERRELEEKRKIAIEEALSKGKLARAEVNNEKAQRKQPVHVAAPVKKAQPVAEEEDQSFNLDIGVIQKFGRMNITAPTHKDHLPRVIKDLEELKLAFLEKGDEERNYAKAKFLRYCGHGKDEVKTPVATAQPEEDKKASLEGEEALEAPVKASNDKLRLVEKIIS